MRCVCGVGLALLWLLGVPLSAQQEGASVVIVNTERESGYGVASLSPDNIVTALHVVAGKSKILVTWNGKSVPATIKAVNKDADLALLALQKPLGVPALEIYQGDPPSGTRIDYWEVPVNSTRVDRKETRLDGKRKAIELREFDSRIERDPGLLARSLCSDGANVYPSLNTKILKFEEANVSKSHSGSPLTYKGRIVGMVDGGQRIGAKSSVWAIPAAGNFEALFASAAPPRLQKCATERLYGGLRADNPLLQNDARWKPLADAIAESEHNPITMRDNTNDEIAFVLQERINFKELFMSLPPDMQNEIREMLQEDAEFEEDPVRLEELFRHSVDILEDYASGVALAVPTGSRMTQQERNGNKFIEVRGRDARVQMIASVQITRSRRELDNARQWFEQHIVSDGRKWVKDVHDQEEDYEDSALAQDPDDPYYSTYFDRVVYNSENEVVAELFASMTMDESDFLGVAIKIDDFDTLTRASRIYYYLTEACAMMSDFNFE